MKLRWLGVITAGLLFFTLHPAEAKFLYQPDDQGFFRSDVEPWREAVVTDNLSPAERRTLQRNFAYRALFTPNDPQFSLQWNFQAIQAPLAWEYDQIDPVYGGDPGVLVAVLDTGLAYEGFQGYIRSDEISDTRIWTNSADPVDGLDNDGNGFVDDVHGWDFVNNDAHPNDDHGHGTHITGTIAGQTNNGTAVAGLAWHSTILPLKVLDNAGNGSTSTITAAVNYAIQAGADIINLSLGGNNDDALLHQAIQTAVSRGIVVVAAAGNDGAGALNYPARYSEVIAVGAIQYDQTRASYSNFGSNLDLVAPGGNVTLDQNSDGQPDGIAQQTCSSAACTGFGTYFYTGSSQAAAHVAGGAALLLACGVPGGSVASGLSAAATDLGPVGVDTEYGAGLLNLNTALSQLGCTPSNPATPGTITAISSAGTTRTIRSRVAAPYTKPVFQWSGNTGTVYQVTWGKQGALASTLTQTSTTFAPTLTSQGLYQLTVTAVDGLGRQSASQIYFYRYRRPSIALGIPGVVAIAEISGTRVRSWSAQTGTAVPVISSPTLSGQSLRLAVSGLDVGTAVRVMTTRGNRLAAWRPFGATLSGGISTASVRRTEAETLLAVTGSNVGATVRWLTQTGARVRSQKVFTNHNRGVTMASADLDGDGTDELITAKNGGSLLAAFTVDGRRLWQVQPFGSNWQGQWSLAALDRDNDGRDEVAVGGLRVNGTTAIVILTSAGKKYTSWTLTPSTGLGRVELASADVNGNGTEELLSLSNRGAGHVDVWSSKGKRASTIIITNTIANQRFTILN